MKKVLMVAGGMNVGGLENMLMNFIRYGDNKNIRFDFMLNYEGEHYYSEEIRRYGGTIYTMPRLKPKNIFRYPAEVIKFFIKHKGEYDVLHGNLTSVGMIYLPAAKIFGKIKKRIIHAHYTSTEQNHYERLERLMLYPLRFLSDYYFACSDMAGEFCFGKHILNKPNYRMIHNGVDCDKFDYNEQLRAEIRKKMGLDDQFVIINIGRLEEQKNQRYLLKIVEELKKRDIRAKILVAGEGSLRPELEKIIRDKDLGDFVSLLGLRDDMAELMQASDAFILTSLFEGLPVAGIEAQAAGLPCILADTITKELDITGNTKFISLDADIDLWIDAIISAMDFKRKSTSDIIKNKGYDIKREAKWLSDFYMSDN